MENFIITCPCLFGVESVLKGEVQRMGFSDISVQNGRVSFRGAETEIARANLGLYTAERVLIELGSFRAESFEELFQGVRALALERFIGKDDRFPVKGSALNSKLKSIPDCQAIIKKAAVERLKSVYHLEWFPETGILFQIQFTILKDIATIYLDTTGAPLYKRGYRVASVRAPIRETLAAAIVDLARIRPGSTVVDPFCGCGTFLAESALKALRIAPGINRRFVSEGFSPSFSSAYCEERRRLEELRRDGNGFHAYGSDADGEAVEIARGNLRSAHLQCYATVQKMDVTLFDPPKGPYTVITNPPYGERLLDQKAARKLYQTLGEKTKDAQSIYVITSDEEFETWFGRRAAKKRKLYNGMLKCTLYEYFTKG